MSLTRTRSSVVTERRVEFINQSGEKLVGTLCEVGTKPCVILCHGYTSNKDGFHMPRIAAELAGKRIASFRFDFSGNGESEGVFEYGNYAKEAQDIRSALEFLQGKLGLKVVALLGHSKGGDSVLVYGAKYDDVPMIINVAGRYDMRAGITERFGADVHERLESLGQIHQRSETRSGELRWVLTKHSMAERLGLDMQAVGRAITSSEVLTVHGSADVTIPVADAHHFARCIASHTLVVVEGADHNFRGEPAHSDIMVKRVVDFISKGV